MSEKIELTTEKKGKLIISVAENPVKKEESSVCIEFQSQKAVFVGSITRTEWRESYYAQTRTV